MPNFEEQNKVMEPSIIIIISYYYYYFILQLYCIINAQYNYYISNKGLLKKCGKEENLEVNGLLLLPVSKEDGKTFCPVSIIRPITAKLAPQW